jgi:hypothetical protein
MIAGYRGETREMERIRAKQRFMKALSAAL